MVFESYKAWPAPPQVNGGLSVFLQSFPRMLTPAQPSFPCPGILCPSVPLSHQALCSLGTRTGPPLCLAHGRWPADSRPMNKSHLVPHLTPQEGSCWPRVPYWGPGTPDTGWSTPRLVAGPQALWIHSHPQRSGKEPQHGVTFKFS